MLLCEKRREICSVFGFNVYLVGKKLDLFLNQIYKIYNKKKIKC